MNILRARKAERQRREIQQHAQNCNRRLRRQQSIVITCRKQYLHVRTLGHDRNSVLGNEAYRELFNAMKHQRVLANADARMQELVNRIDMADANSQVIECMSQARQVLRNTVRPEDVEDLHQDVREAIDAIDETSASLGTEVEGDDELEGEYYGMAMPSAPVAALQIHESRVATAI